ncbi:uncharacterized protein [Spinacia oleracea]|uniref:Retrotransposon Copia-like N-terminal domain-containing protein n=1 Tax=Spinacia oleracea TaxID=3562 RepID=A0ABM3QPY9_SPIOL|nr:uncharacterized protein LOC130461372 [Spinacia oleracea]
MGPKLQAQPWATPPCPYPSCGWEYRSHSPRQVQPQQAGVLGARPQQSYFMAAAPPSMGYAPTDIDQTMHTMSLHSPYDNWYMDTGATSHVTSSQGDDKIDPASPYYLSSGDQPGIVITHVLLRLTGVNNYMAWARATQLSLQSRRKFVCVDGTITKPTEKKRQLDWVTVNSMLVSWMLRSMEPKIANSIPFYDNAKKLWDYLANKYGVANGPRL